MNLFDRYKQFKHAELFNKADIKDVISVNGYSFDVRIVGGEMYANGLLLEDFFSEAMLTLDEQIVYEQAIYNWLSKIFNSRVA